MQSISIITNPTTENLVGRSHWWGAPDLPEDVPYPYVMVDDTQVVMGCNGMPKRDIHGNVIIEHGEDYPEPLTFICQIRMEDCCPVRACSISSLPSTIFLATVLPLRFPCMAPWATWCA